MTKKPLDPDSQDFVDDQRERANSFISNALRDAANDGVSALALATACLKAAAQIDGLDCAAHGLDEAEMMAARGATYERVFVATVARELAKRHALAALPPAGQA